MSLISDVYKNSTGYSISPGPGGPALQPVPMGPGSIPAAATPTTSSIFNKTTPATTGSQLPPAPVDTRDPKAAAAAIAAAVTKATVGDIPTYAATQFQNPNPSVVQAETSASELNNTRNDLATGTTDPYKWGAQSGIPYTAAELNAIEKASAGIYDPALNSALARLDNAKTLQELNAKNAASGVSGADTLAPYTKQSYNGYNYADLSSLTPSQKAQYAKVAQAAGIVPVFDSQTASKLNAISDANTNLDNINSSLQTIKLGTQGLGVPGAGLENSVSKLFGQSDIKSYNAWRTAIINNVQALAGGQGSGLRINQAEINAAMDNDLPIVTGPKADSVSSAAAKLQKLRTQLNSWELQLVGGGLHAGQDNTIPGAATAGTGDTAPIRVKDLSSGQTGTIPANEFDASLYQKL